MPPITVVSEEGRDDPLPTNPHSPCAPVVGMRGPYLADLVGGQHDDVGPFVKALGSREVANSLLVQQTEASGTQKGSGPCSPGRPIPHQEEDTPPRVRGLWNTVAVKSASMACHCPAHPHRLLSS